VNRIANYSLDISRERDRLDWEENKRRAAARFADRSASVDERSFDSSHDPTAAPSTGFRDLVGVLLFYLTVFAAYYLKVLE
jgi:hypothetical protein